MTRCAFDSPLRWNASSLIAITLVSVSLIGCDSRRRAQDVAKELADSNRRPSTHTSESPTHTSESPTSSPTAGYVPDQTCQECHADIFETYQDVGMANSYYPADADNLIEDFENAHYYHSASDRHYEMYVQDDGIFQRRYQVDSDGERINEINVRADAIIGSGNHIRSYVYSTPAGEMFQMPLAWYTQEAKWRLNPGYDNANHLGFQRKITRECMFCHNAYPLDVQAGTDAHGYPPLFPEQLPHGIGCQRCHGPGQEHIELASDDEIGTQQIRHSIVNPENLEPKLRDDVCYQCHMQPSSEVVSEMVRFDRGEYSYRPGEPLNEYRALLDFKDDSSSEDRFEINHHGYRMRQSPCHLEGQDSLSCVTCHDPHRKVLPENRLTHYRDVCLTCHQVDQCSPATDIESSTAAIRDDASVGAGREAAEHHEALALADCVQCHMPKRRTHDVIHATMTDHRIVKRAASEQERLAPREEPGGVPSDIEVFPYRLPSDPVGPHSRNGNSWTTYLAVARSQVGNWDSVKQLAEMFRSGSDFPFSASTELAMALQDRRDMQNVIKLRSKLAQDNPDRPQANLDLAMSFAAVGQHASALVYYRRAIASGLPLPEAHVGVGTSMLHRNAVPKAIEHFREAVRLRPYYPEALLNLGIALHSQQQWDEARSMLLRAKAADPTFVEADSYLQAIP